MMTIYVDEVRYFETSSIKGFAKRYGNRWCHLFSDDTAYPNKELHEFAASIGCRRGWFQEPNLAFPHYDLVPSRREAAVAAGAEEVELKVWLKQNRRRAAL